jgi:hypothetical protein
MIYKLQDIFKEKKSDTAIFLGCGESINDITTEEWSKMKKFDVWTSNNFHYHSFIPNFYHVEVKNRDRVIWRHRHLERADKYRNVKFICHSQEIVDLIGPDAFDIYMYKMIKLGDARIPVPNYKMPEQKDQNILTCVGGISFTMLFELWYQMKYEKVILFGVDLYNSRYFWTDQVKFGKTHCHHNKDFEGKRETDPHNAAHLMTFIEGIGIRYLPVYIGYKKSLLYPRLPFLSLTETP